MSLTQLQIIKEHLLHIGPINTDEARQLYAIADAPKVVSDLSKIMNIEHKPINRKHPVTGKLRGIAQYTLLREKPITDNKG